MTCDLSLITSTEVSEELFASSSSDDELEKMNSMYHHCQNRRVWLVGLP